MGSSIRRHSMAAAPVLVESDWPIIMKDAASGGVSDEVGAGRFAISDQKTRNSRVLELRPSGRVQVDVAGAAEDS
eukprot:scaffold29169_cov14-Prasinocladus_malaysianus.AAC.1